MATNELALPGLPVGTQPTKEAMLGELRALCPKLSFAMREPHDLVYVPPGNLWQRIKQIFTGPKQARRNGVAQISIHGSNVKDRDLWRMVAVLHDIRPAGVLIELIVFEP